MLPHFKGFITSFLLIYLIFKPNFTTINAFLLYFVSYFGPFGPIWSTSVLFNPPWFYPIYFGPIRSNLSTSVQVGSIRSIMSTLVLFGLFSLSGPNRSILVLFGPICLSYSVQFGHIRFTLVLFGLIWSNSVDLVLFGLLRSIFFYSVQFGPIRSTLALFGPLCSLWFYLVHYVHFGPIRSIPSNSVLFSPIWFYSVQFGLIRSIWYYSVHRGPIWSYSVDSFYFGHIGYFFFIFDLFGTLKANEGLSFHAEDSHRAS